MKILAVEFSSSHRSVAVLDSTGAVLGTSVEINGRNVIALVEQALAQAATSREEIEVLAVGLGPGSYAGIRGALALAQGWQLGRQIKVLGVSSVDCLAADAQRESIFGEVNIVIDAQRNEFYLARFELGPQTSRLIEPLRLAAFPEIESLAGRGPLAGPDAAARFPSAANLFPTAATLGRLAVGRTDFVTADTLEPIYLRVTAFLKAPPPRVIPGRW
jgi:tRNA threonylcarbamoyladenosine biosynthesis protein TsaB